MAKRKNRKKPVQLSTLLDINILAYNRSDLLKRCLEYIPAAVGDIAYKVYVLNNGSKPEEAEKIKSLCREFDAVYVNSSKNVGFPAGNNRLVRVGTSPLLLFLNDDAFMYPASIKNMVMALDDPTIGIVGAKLIFDPASTSPSRPAGMVQHVGLSTNPSGNFFHHLIGWKPDNPKVLKVHYPYVVTGACMMTRRSIFKQIGGFNEDYGLGTSEDVEFCLHARYLGYNIYLEQEAIGIHLVGATAMSENMGFPVQANMDLLKMRWRDKLQYTEWEIW